MTDRPAHVVVLVLVLAGAFEPATAAPARSYDVLIDDGTIYDGRGGEPYVGDVGIVGDKLCLVMGDRARDAGDPFLRHLGGGDAVDNPHRRAVASLLPHRVGAMSFDLGRIYDGCLAAAPFWHADGRLLRNTPLEARIPAAAAFTVEDGALRVALRVEPKAVAAAAHQISALLR